MFRDIIESTINIRSTIYTLKVTENKRQLIYVDGVFDNTNPHVLENGVIVTTSSLSLDSVNKSLTVISPNSKSLIKHTQFKPCLSIIPALKSNRHLIVRLETNKSIIPISSSVFKVFFRLP